VIVDPGVHLELHIPAGTGLHEGERWAPDLGVQFILTCAITDGPHVPVELDGYLGWPGPGQASTIGDTL